MNSNLKKLDEFIKVSKIRHISFDFWNTLAKSNPEFKKNRFHYFKGLNHSLSVDEFENAFRFVSSRHNDRFLVDGVHSMQSYEMYDEVIKILNIEAVNSQNLNSHMGDLFLANPPLFTDYMNPEWMNELNAVAQITFSITSNTAFVEGKYIREVINRFCQNIPFSFMKFSDEHLSGKPGTAILSELHKSAQNIHNGIKKYEILHVGDDELFDIQSADNFGLRYFKV